MIKEQCTDVRFVLEGDMFVKVGKSCKHSNLENRSPFMDSSIVEFALGMPSDYKLRGRNKKFILKEVFNDIIPTEVFKWRKHGFGVPVDYWFRNQLKDELQSLLSYDKMKQQGIFNPDYIQTIMNEHFNGEENHKTLLWNLFVFQKWYYKRYIR